MIAPGGDPRSLTSAGPMRRFNVTTVLGETFVYHCEAFNGHETDVSLTMRSQSGDTVFLKTLSGRLISLAHVVSIEPQD